MTSRILRIIDEKFKLTEKECGEFRSLKVAGMNFENFCFKAENLGNVAVMKITSDNGVMSMDTLVINPFEIDAPMVSYDCINMQNIAILYLEPFDTMLEKNFDTSAIKAVVDEYETTLENNTQSARWYDDMRLDGTAFKKTQKKELLEEMVEKYYVAYIETLSNTPKCDENAKKERAAIYSDGLIERGGPATDPFLQAFGKEKTKQFFEEVLFGV